MLGSQTYSKTPLGIQEVTTRKLNLAPGLRNALILVDKSRPLEKLTRDAMRIGSPDDFIEQLLALGLITTTAPTSGSDETPASTNPAHALSTTPNLIIAFDLRNAQKQLVKLIEKTLGPSGERFALSVESTDTKDEFLAIASHTKTVLTSVNARAANDPFWATVGL